MNFIKRDEMIPRINLEQGLEEELIFMFQNRTGIVICECRVIKCKKKAREGDALWIGDGTRTSMVGWTDSSIMNH